MAFLKCTMLFSATSAISDPNFPIHRSGGWSESWYYPAGVPADALANMTGLGPVQIANPLCPARARLLPTGIAIVGQRIQQVDPAGPSQVFSANFPGGAGTLEDIPQMGLLIYVQGTGVSNIRRSILRGIPDARVQEGEYFKSQDFNDSLLNFFAALSVFKFRGRDLTQPKIKIVSMLGDGTVSTETPHGYGINDMVRIMRTTDTNKKFQGGRFQVMSAVDATTFKVRNWLGGSTTGGSVRKDGIVYPAIDKANVSVGRIVTRRVGRPFISYRGRRSKRR